MKSIWGLVLVAAAANATTVYDVVTNFNAPNNGSASSVFTYGSGGTPGTFVALPNTTVDCHGASSYCLDSGGNPVAAVSWNGSAIEQDYFTIKQPPSLVQMDPQNTAGVILRFTAPVTGTYSLSGQFQGIDSGQHSTTVKIFQDSTAIFTDTISSFGQVDSFNPGGLSLAAGETIDFIVITNSDCCFLSTGLAAAISGPDVSGVPEPGTLALVGFAIPLAVVLRRRLRRC